MAFRTESNATDNANGETNAGTCERPKSSRALIVLAWLAAVVALHHARDVIIPVVLAALLALLLRPIFRWLQRWQLPDVLASFLIVFAVAALFVGAMLTVA